IPASADAFRRSRGDYVPRIEREDRGHEAYEVRNVVYLIASIGILHDAIVYARRDSQALVVRQKFLGHDIGAHRCRAITALLGEPIDVVGLALALQRLAVTDVVHDREAEHVVHDIVEFEILGLRTHDYGQLALPVYLGPSIRNYERGAGIGNRRAWRL